MLVFSFLLLALASLLQGAAISKRAQKLSIVPCGSPSNLLSLKDSDIKLKPYPPAIPGTLDVSVLGSLNQDIPNLYIDATIAKIFFGGRTRTEVPCISGYGSCVYDICELTKSVTSCPDIMQQYGIPCKCPFTKFSLNTFHESFTIKTLPPIVAWLTDGDYEANVKVLSSPTGQPLACYDIKVTIVSKSIDCENPLFKYGPDCRGTVGK